MGKVYPNGSQEVTVSDKIAIFTEGKCDVYYYYDQTGLAPKYEYSSSVENEEVVLTPGSGVSKVRLDAGSASTVEYATGSAPVVTRKVVSEVSEPANAGESIQAESLVRNTIADSGTVTVAQHRDQVLYQDASGGNVTMTTATGTNLAAEFTNLPIGGAIRQYVASNHASNTSTISGGTGVTLVGSGAVTNTGGLFLLIKTAAATFDLVRVG